MLSTITLTPVVFQAVRVTPRLLECARVARHPMPPAPLVQKRNYGIVDIVVQTTIGIFLHVRSF